MNKKILSISLILLIGFAIGSIFSGCNSKTIKVQASEKGYLTYCGVQNDILGGNSVAIYEDSIHGKVIYIGTAYHGNIAITVTNK